MNPLAPSLSLLCKLGSALVHIEELTSEIGRADFDLPALKVVMHDPEVQEWLAAMQKLALLPVKR